MPSRTIANSLARNSTERAPASARGSLNTPPFQALVPKHETIAIPDQNLQPVAPARAEYEQVTAEGILPDDRPHPFGQTVEATAHVGRLGGQPDPRALRLI
jgi:hypothetical protein